MGISFSGHFLPASSPNLQLETDDRVVFPPLFQSAGIGLVKPSFIIIIYLFTRFLYQLSPGFLWRTPMTFPPPRSVLVKEDAQVFLLTKPEQSIWKEKIAEPKQEVVHNGLWCPQYLWVMRGMSSCKSQRHWLIATCLTSLLIRNIPSHMASPVFLHFPTVILCFLRL